MKKVTRRQAMQATGAASIAALAGCTGSSNSKQDNDSSNKSNSNKQSGNNTVGSDNANHHIGLITFSMSNSWFQCFANSGKWYAKSQDVKFTITDGKIDSATQVRNAQNLLNTGVDGLIMSAADSDASSTIVDNANQEGVPVFNASVATNSKNVPLYIGFGNKRAGKRSAQALIDLLPKKNGEPTGDIAEVMIEQNTFLGRSRHQGFQEVVSKYENVNVVGSILTQNTQQGSQQKVTSFLQKNPDIDGFNAQAITTGNGTVRALQNRNMLKPKGNEEHIYLTQIDAGPQPNKFIRKGYIDFCTDQPTQFFTPIAIHYMTKYLQSGENSGGDFLYDTSVLPSVGDTVKASNLDISGNVPKKRFGVNIWKKSIWSPAKIVEHPEFPLRAWFQFPAVDITPKNADANWLWGNWITNALK